MKIFGSLALTLALGAIPAHAAGAEGGVGTVSTSGTAGFSGAGTMGSTLPLPKGYSISSLGTLYRDAKVGVVKTATVNTTFDVVLFTEGGHKYAAQYVATSSADLVNHLLDDNVNVTVSTATTLGTGGQDSGALWQPLLIISMALLSGLFIYRRRAKKGPFGLNPRRRVAERAGVHDAVGSGVADVPTTTFNDVAGVDEAVEDLREFVAFLQEPERFARVGAKRPKGALMVGPPGTGKTLLARAVAGEAGVPFYSASGSDFVEMYVGVGPKRIRELFARAKKSERAIVFIDEIDAVARRRTGGAHQASDAERDSTLIALLNEMDGFRDSGVIVLAATNRPDVLDPAIMRPGRLDRRVEVPHPDRRGREKILRVHSATRPLASDVDLESVARRTSGMSGADMANIVNEAAIAAARDNATEVTSAHFDSAIMTVLMGRARHSALVSDNDRAVTAWHEAGHTVCAYLQEAADPPVSVSIVPRGPAGGVTAMSEGDDYFLSRSKAAARLVTALGGRCGEELLVGADYTQGAHGDLQTATNLAGAMVMTYAMTAAGLTFRDATSAKSKEVEAAIEDLLVRAHEEASRILGEHEDFVRVVAEELLREDTLQREDLDRLYAQVGSPKQVGSEETLRAFYQ